MSKNYAIKQTEENTWVMLNENEEVVNTITKDIVVDYCEKENEEIEELIHDVLIDYVWSNLEEDYNIDYINNDCQDFDKFVAWFEYVCVEYFSQEIIAIYKQRLLDFE